MRQLLFFFIASFFVLAQASCERDKELRNHEVQSPPCNPTTPKAKYRVNDSTSWETYTVSAVSCELGANEAQFVGTFNGDTLEIELSSIDGRIYRTGSCGNLYFGQNASYGGKSVCGAVYLIEEEEERAVVLCNGYISNSNFISIEFARIPCEE